MTKNISAIAAWFGSNRSRQRSIAANDRCGPARVPNEPAGAAKADARFRSQGAWKGPSDLAHRSRRDGFRRSRLPTGAAKMASGGSGDRSRTAGVAASIAKLLSPILGHQTAAVELRAGFATVRHGTSGERSELAGQSESGTVECPTCWTPSDGRRDRAERSMAEAARSGPTQNPLFLRAVGTVLGWKCGTPPAAEWVRARCFSGLDLVSGGRWPDGRAGWVWMAGRTRDPPTG